jgi:hypothetical protein
MFSLLSGTSIAADYYVSSTVGSSGTGSSASPWKTWGNIDWDTVNTDLSSEVVNIYFDSRATWASEDHTITRNDGSVNLLTISGDQKYLDGTWQAETVAGNRATFASGGGTIYPEGANCNYVAIRGFYQIAPAWGGVAIGAEHGTTGKHHMTIQNMKIVNPQNNHGIYAGNMTSGFTDFHVKDNYIEGTPLECIYVGQYDYLTDNQTGVIVEGNTCKNTGLLAEGDIDIKPSAYGAIVRNNTVYRESNANGGNCGVVVSADAVQITGNRFYLSDMKSDLDWGFGIFLNSEGDGAGNAKAITSGLIANNLIYSNAASGIRIMATHEGFPIAGVKVLNNTIVGNAIYGLEVSASSTTITLSDVVNNIFASNISQDISITSGVTLTSCDYNLYYRASGNSWKYQGSEKTWAQWQALGFDAHGVNADPLLTNYIPGVGSPAIASGVDLSATFTTDILGVTRPQGVAWDIGAYEFLGLTGTGGFGRWPR